MIIRVLLSKDVGTQKMKTDGPNSIFNVVGKRKTKTEFRIPFSDDVGKNETECSNSVFLFRRKTVGTKVHTRRIRKPLAGCGSWFANSSRVLPTSRVVYQLTTQRNLWSIA